MPPHQVISSDGQDTKNNDYISCRYARKLLVIIAVIIGTFLLWYLAPAIHRKQLLRRLVDGRPEQIRISPGSDYSEVVVMWTSRIDSSGYVMFGRQSARFEARCRAVTIEIEDSINSGYFIPYVYRCELTKLLPGAIYFYKVVVDRYSSPVFQFRTFNNAADSIVNLLVGSDIGVHSKTVQALTNEYQLRSIAYDAVLHLGDIAYNIEPNGDSFMRKMEPLVSQLLYLTIPGNHENQSLFKHYRHRFSLPGVKWPIPTGEMRYSFDLGKTHFVFYDTELYQFQPHYIKQQHDWLRKDLQKANLNRKQRPWIVVFGHRPLYCSNYINPETNCSSLQTAIRESVERLFFEQGVDLIVSGHEHSYERSWPVYNFSVYGHSYVDAKAPVHIVNGSPAVWFFLDVFEDAVNPKPEWSAFRSAVAGVESFGRLAVVNDTHLRYTCVESVSSRILDDFWLVQHNHSTRQESLPMSSIVT
ncbi:acid phosphatase type 7-like [Tubulanus polymorphus]|uniref:acid phosphatase type 7-like n=1 Tax=Tubulanus polymorphus TaxID=672921 RepID=UPI003DA26761